MDDSVAVPRRESTLWRKLTALVETPWYAAFVAFLAVFAGLLGSVYAEDIKRAFPLVWVSTWTKLSWTAFAFWISTIVFAVLFFARQRHDDALRAQLASSTKQIEGTASQIEMFVQTLPPATFRSNLELLGRQNRLLVDSLAPRALSPARREDLPKAIQSALHAIAALAFVFDGAPHFNNKPARYAANVMLFIPRAHTPPFFSDAVTSSLRFFPAAFDISELRGVLLLDPTMTSTSRIAELDDQIGPLALPIPQSATNAAGKYIVLPGAPLAFVTAGADGYDDAREIGTWCRKQGDFLPSMIDELVAYFADTGPGAQVRSFLSKALGPEDEPFAVVNVHANRPALLGPDVSRRGIFLQMIDPLTDDLAALVRLSRNASS